MWGDRQRKRRFDLSEFWADQTGVVTVTYCWPGGATGNTTTAPAAAAASAVNTQTVKVAMADSDTSAVIVHNWGLPASFPSFLFPIITYYQDTIGVGPSTDLPTLTFDLSNTNQVTITKLNAVGSGGTYRVFLSRPASLIR
jgi:hypothetical protein